MTPVLALWRVMQAKCILSKNELHELDNNGMAKAKVWPVCVPSDYVDCKAIKQALLGTCVAVKVMYTLEH